MPWTRFLLCCNRRYYFIRCWINIFNFWFIKKSLIFKEIFWKSILIYTYFGAHWNFCLFVLSLAFFQKRKKNSGLLYLPFKHLKYYLQIVKRHKSFTRCLKHSTKTYGNKLFDGQLNRVQKTQTIDGWTDRRTDGGFC